MNKQQGKNTRKPLSRKQKCAIALMFFSFLLYFAVPPLGAVGIIIGIVIFLRDRKRQRNDNGTKDELDVDKGTDNLIDLASSEDKSSFSSETETGKEAEDEPQKSILQSRSDAVAANKLNPKLIFPAQDASGNRLLRVYDTTVTGVTHKHDGIDPQERIEELEVGEELILEADPDNKHDKDATQVITVEGQQIGWIPQADDHSNNLHADVAKRLREGLSVRACVKKLYTQQTGATGVIIYVGRYAKPQKTENEI